MINSNRTFTITKLKKNIKTIDSFVSMGEETLILLTSLGRIFKFNLSDNFITSTSKQSQGLALVKLLPTEKIVSCCQCSNEEKFYLVSQQGKIFCFNNNEIYYAIDNHLGYLSDKTQLKNDCFIKILSNNQYLDIETNKNKSARLNFEKLNFKSNKAFNIIDLFKLDNDEYLEKCFGLEKLLS